MRTLNVAVGLVALLLATLLVACGDDDAPPAAIVATQTASPAPTVVATEPPPVATEAPTEVATATVAPTTPASTATRAPIVPAVAPTTGQWIDVNVTNFTVRLMNGTTATQTIGPVGVGVEVNTGNYASTQTGLFLIYDMRADLSYDAPYDTYISHWVGFDPAKDNGFHSFLKDASGAVVDPSTGRVSNGCIRTGSAEAIYAYAEIGMPVFVHL